MIKFKSLVFLLLSILLMGCSDPVIDSSSQETFESSLDSLKADMTSEQSEELTEALQVVMFKELDVKSMMALAMSGADPEEFGQNLGKDAMARMNGMTAIQIIAEAEKIKVDRRVKQIEVLQEEISSLVSDVEAMARAKQEFDLKRSQMTKISFSKTKLYWRKSSFMDDLILELTVTNGLDQAISNIYVEGTLATPGRSVPWVVENFSYDIPGGLEPNETKSLSLAPNEYTDWGKTPKNRDDTVLTLALIDADDAEGNDIFDTDYDQAKFEKLADKLAVKKDSLLKLQKEGQG